MLKQYEGKPFTLKPNKLQIEPITFSFSDMDLFNKIYKYVKENYLRVEPTNSKSMPYDTKYKYHERYMIVKSKSAFELTVICYDGCYRFIIGNIRNEEENPISGKEAVRVIYKQAKKLGINLSKYAVSSDYGKDIKKTISKPHIEIYGRAKRPYSNVHHLDLNSSYASRIIEVYPELAPLYEEMYRERHNKDNYYKHVLTNHIGCWQSVHCPDVNDSKRIAPYQFANLARIAVDGTRTMIETYVEVLKKSGRNVLLTNTDGIWYQGEIYHDENEGNELCQWKNDHINCTLIMKSKGAYQYIEDGVCHTVVRGTTNLDKEKERDDWEFGDIFKDVKMDCYAFDDNEGVIKDEQEI